MRKAKELYREVLDGMENNLEEFFAPAFSEMDPVQVGEKENYYQINIDLPGVKRSDLDIEIKEDSLFIDAIRKDEFESEGAYERNYGKFSRSLRLPTNVNQEQVEASLEDGILRILLPKTSAKSCPRKIEIQNSHQKLKHAS